MASETVPGVAEAERYLDETAEERLADYLAFLRIPSISALSQHRDDIRAAAAFVADRLTGMGVEHVEVSETGGHPIVYGDWLHASDAPTVVVYGHYDVQPVDPLDLWDKPPFEPVVDNGRVFGRGAADDKGQIHIHLSAAEALLKATGKLPSSRSAQSAPRARVRARATLCSSSTARVRAGAQLVASVVGAGAIGATDTG
jgi:acetylornithine deacetylase/succinyl-diaminopimelate desuccinylase-like protein